MRTRVKICGITRPSDAEAAARAGVDAIGLVFYPPSPRAVDIPRAQAIAAVLPPFVSTVALFVNAAPETVRGVLDAVPIDLLQFQGDEPPEQCGGYARPYVKAIRMRPGTDLEVEARRYADARALLPDAYHPTLHGGTGQSFDWSRLPSRLEKPVILAGGLTPANVAQAIRVARPYGVDVSGGVEAEKGIKDPAKMAAFLAEVARADERLRAEGPEQA
jgi:phosphoribosylanthranilate isomerase